MKKTLFVFLFLLALSFPELSAQQMFRDIESVSKSQSGMVVPFSTQVPTNVYKQRHIHRSNINVEYHRRDNVSRPVHHNGDLVMGWQSQRIDNSRLVFSNQSNGYYTQTPKSVNEAVAERVTYNSFPTINSRGWVVSVESEEVVVETGGMQALPGNWGEPGMPIGDFALPMLLLVGVYVLVRFKGLNR